MSEGVDVHPVPAATGSSQPAPDAAAVREAERRAAEREKLDARRFRLMLIAQLAQVLVGVIALMCAQAHVSTKVDAVNAQVQELKAAESLTIELSGAGVGETEIIRGTTPYADRNHYLIVEPEVTHENWVHGPASVASSGEWQVRAQFGQGSVGLYKRFTIRCLVTKERLAPGRLTNIPADAIFSPAIDVERTR